MKFGKSTTKTNKSPVSDEWWVIFKGSLKLRIKEDDYSLNLKEKDVVLIESGTSYSLSPLNSSGAIAISVRGPEEYK